MKKRTIRSHLVPYSIFKKRKTTINHAFASAIAPVDQYDDAKVSKALRTLGQDPNGELSCVYCEDPAETWDHLIGLVENEELRGYGHQLGNLVPCCRRCNSKKGGKGWDVYLREVALERSAFETKYGLIKSCLERYAAPVTLDRAAEMLPGDWMRYREIKEKLFLLMAEADAIAARLRGVVASKPSE